MSRSSTLALGGITSLMLLVGCATSGSSAPAEWDGLQKRNVKGLDAVYVRPNVQFAPYKKVLLDPIQVEFSKNWDPNSSTPGVSRDLDATDLQKIKDGLAELFREVFAEELEKGGYSLTDTPAADTLRVSAAIIDLYINAPDAQSSSAARTYTFTTDAGSMTLAMECRDSPTGQILARVVDARRGDSMGGTMQWTTGVTNRAEAQQIIKAWARKLREGLDRLNGLES